METNIWRHCESLRMKSFCPSIDAFQFGTSPQSNCFWNLDFAKKGLITPPVFICLGRNSWLSTKRVLYEFNKKRLGLRCQGLHIVVWFWMPLKLFKVQQFRETIPNDFFHCQEASIKTAHADELLRRQHAHEAFGWHGCLMFSWHVLGGGWSIPIPLNSSHSDSFQCQANVMALKTQRTKLEEEIQMKNSEVVSQKEQFLREFRCYWGKYRKII